MHRHRRRSNRLIHIAALCALMLPAATLPAQTTTTPAAPSSSKLTTDELRQRVDAVTAELREQMTEHHVPGAGLAIVHGDEILLCTGFGHADIASDVDVTGDTVFAIGSATKAFTATLIGMQVDAGTMQWDGTVHEYLPDFHLSDPDADADMSIRDLLAHRTGLGRMGLLWASGQLSRQEVLEATAGAEMFYPFRSQFNYSNINFIAAGEASAQVAGMPWEQLLQQRLLNPLQMHDTTVTVEAARRHGDLAIGYMYDESSGEFEVDPMRPIDAGAPAGAINSSARDMGNWLRFQIADGAFNGKRLISEDAINEARSPQMSMGPGMDYGLGWMLSTWDEFDVVEHGGNIDGFSAQVAFIDELDLGYVLLMNCSFSRLQATANSVVFGGLLAGEESADDGPPHHVLLELVGKYVADFGPFQDDRFTVQINDDGNLAVDVPGQMLFELKPPDDNGRWPFAMTNQIAVSFLRNDNNEVTALVLHQGGLDIELPREGVEIVPEVELADVRDYLGTYHFEEAGIDFETLIHNGRLAVDVPGELTYELHLPDDQQRWVFRAIDNIWVRFNRGEDGQVESMTMTRPDMEALLPRTSTPDPDKLVTLDDALAARQIDRDLVDSIETMRMTGTVRFTHQNVQGTFEIVARGLDHYRNHIDLGRSGTITITVAGDTGWSESSIDQSDVLEGKYLDAARRQHPMILLADWTEVMDELSLKDVTEKDGRRVYVLRARMGELIMTEITMDAESGRLVSEKLVMMAPGIGALPMDVSYHDYRDVDGLMIPFRFEAHNMWHGTTITTIDSVEFNVELPDDAFQPSDPNL